MKKLSELLVVSLEQAVAAPYCASKFADAGARVIKIEREEGDFARRYDNVVHGESAYFVWINRGKESVCLDIKNSKDRSVLENMISKADIFIQNLAPGATDRLGIGSKDLRSRYPQLITIDISGYGNSGAYKDKKAYDLLIQCETGLASITGTPEAPGRVGLSVCDISCGQQAYGAALEALIRREETGEGCGIEISLFDAIADWMAVPLLHYDYGGYIQERVGLNHATIAPYGAYETLDKKLIVFSIQNEREWHQLCRDVLGQADLADHPDFCDNTRRVQNRDALQRIIQGLFMTKSHRDLSTKLTHAQIAFGDVNDTMALSSHPHLRRINIDTETGPVDMVAPAPKFSDYTPAFRPVPKIGESSDRIKAEFSEEN